MRPKEVLVLAEEYNFKEGTIYRASKELDGMLVNTAGKKAPGNRWEYVGQAAGQPTDRPHFNTFTLHDTHGSRRGITEQSVKVLKCSRRQITEMAKLRGVGRLATIPLFDSL